MCVPYERCDHAQYDMGSLVWLMVDVNMYSAWLCMWFMGHVHFNCMICEDVCVWHMEDVDVYSIIDVLCDTFMANVDV